MLDNVDIGPSSTTLTQRQTNVGPTPRVCWVVVWPENTLGERRAKGAGGQRWPSMIF